MSATIFETMVNHSGYHIPFLHTSRFHDWHHSKITECYGTNGYLDEFHGTSERFQESIECIRNRTLLTLESANKLYPDETYGRSKR